MLMKDKVCVVTGAASLQGIGRVTAELLAEHGAKLVVLDVSDRIDEVAEDLARLHPDADVTGIRCDIACRPGCAEAAERVLATYTRVDALIHSAAVIRSGKYDEISEGEFDDVLRINLTGAFNIARAFAPTLAAQRSGSIVFVSSVAGQRGGGLVGGAHYAASKGGVLSLAKSLARELGPSGVRVNAVTPSLIATNFVTSSVPAERLRELSNAIPLGRPGRPEEVAGACMFLASDLSTYVTGATLDVNGGLHMH